MAPLHLAARCDLQDITMSSDMETIPEDWLHYIRGISWGLLFTAQTDYNYVLHQSARLPHDVQSIK